MAVTNKGKFLISGILALALAALVACGAAEPQEPAPAEVAPARPPAAAPASPAQQPAVESAPAARVSQPAALRTGGS